MSAPNTTWTKTHVQFAFWLIFGDDGSVRLTRRETALERGERAMACTATLPRSLWATPALSATITVGDPAPNTFNLDVQAASEALKQAIGVDIDLQIRSVE